MQDRSQEILLDEGSAFAEEGSVLQTTGLYILNTIS